MELKLNLFGKIQLKITVNIDVRTTDEIITNIAKEYKLNNVEFNFRDKCGVDDLIDAIEGNRVYIPTLYVINKIVKITIKELDLLDPISNYSLISAHLKWNLDELLERMSNSKTLPVTTIWQGNPVGNYFG